MTPIAGGEMLTEDDRKNGWTEAKLKAYHDDADRRAAQKLDWTKRPQKPKMEQNHRYNPHRWRE